MSYKRFLLFLFLISIYEGNYAQSNCKDFIQNEAQFAAHKLNSQIIPQTQQYDVIHHKCEWKVDPDIRYIEGKITTTFEVVANAMTTITFELHNDLVVDSVFYGTTKLTFTHQNNLLDLNLPALFSKGFKGSVTIFYQGIPASSGFGSFVKQKHKGNPILWTFSVPYGGKDWWPCKQDLNDKVDSLDIFVTTTKKNKVASNGMLINEFDVDSNYRTFHWKHRYSIASYLICFSVTNYQHYNHNADLHGTSLPISNYVYPEDSTTSVSQTKKAIEIIQFYDSVFGEYPFIKEKYGHAQFGWGGGMEHQTMSFMGNFSFDLIAHEMAHQWFGNSITCGSWKDTWLNEGFATYATGLTTEHFEGKEDFYWWRRSEINQIISQNTGSVRVDDTTDVGRIFDGRLTYAKGGMLLHMLRYNIGDKAFFNGLKKYANHPNLKFHYARTSDLKKIMEEASGINLTEFFEDWYKGSGYSIYSAEWNQKEDTAVVKISVLQSDTSQSIFKTKVPITFYGVSDTLSIDIKIEKENQKLNVIVPFSIQSIDINSDYDVIAKTDLISKNDTLQLTKVSEIIDSKMNIFPNPANNKLTIKSRHPSSIKLFDLSGKLLYQSISLKQFHQLNMSHYPAGIFILEVTNTLNKSFHKIVKQ